MKEKISEILQVKIKVLTDTGAVKILLIDRIKGLEDAAVDYENRNMHGNKVVDLHVESADFKFSILDDKDE